MEGDGVYPSPGSFKYSPGISHGRGLPFLEPLYEYNAELKIPFNQVADTVYWLKIAALVDPLVDADPGTRIEWGWHNRDWTLTDLLASPVPAPGEHVQGFTPGPVRKISICSMQS